MTFMKNGDFGLRSVQFNLKIQKSYFKIVLYTKNLIWQNEVRARPRNRLGMWGYFVGSFLNAYQCYTTNVLENRIYKVGNLG